MTYLNKFLEEFDNLEEHQEEKPVGETVMNFGKHKNKSWDYIYDNDLPYIKWIVTNKEDKYIKKIKAYFLQRIEEDYKD